MQNFTVYHVSEEGKHALPFFNDTKLKEQIEVFAKEADKHYEAVAKIDIGVDEKEENIGNVLNFVFRATNTVDFVWHGEKKAKGLTPVFSNPDGCRSTSVGDLIVNDDTGKAWYVVSFGFEPLEVELCL